MTGRSYPTTSLISLTASVSGSCLLSDAIAPCIQRRMPSSSPATSAKPLLMYGT